MTIETKRSHRNYLAAWRPWRLKSWKASGKTREALEREYPACETMKVVYRSEK